MRFDNIKKNFIEHHKKSESCIFHSNSDLTYARKLNVFFEYINQINWGKKSDDEVLKQININIIVDSTKYYCNKYNILFTATVDCYISAISSFFSYLNQVAYQGDKKLINNTFNDKIENEKLLDRIHKIKKELDLEETTQIDSISHKSYTNLRTECDKTLDEFYFDMDYLNRSYYGDYTRFISSIAVKILMITGLKKNRLDELTTDNFDLEKKIFQVYGYSIDIPQSLLKSIEKYINIRKIILEHLSIQDTEDLPFFISLKKAELPTNERLFVILDDVLGNHNSASVSKFTIIQLIKANINIMEIRQLTGFAPYSILHCVEISNEELIQEETETEDFITKMKSNDYFLNQYD